MQGQRSAIGSLPDSINFDYGSTPTNVGIDQQIRWNSLQEPPENRQSGYMIAPGSSDSFMDTIRQEGRSLGRWSIGESSSSTNLPNLINHEERMIQNGWSSSVSTSSGPGLRLDEPLLHEPASRISRNSVSFNLSSNQPPDGYSYMQSSNSGSTSQNLDINAGFSAQVGTGGDLMECSTVSKSGGLEPRFMPSSSGSSEPFASSSGNGGFLAEDDDGRPGCSMDGRRMSCKRKSLEGRSGQSFASGSCFSTEGGSVWPAAPLPSYDASAHSLNVSAPLETTPLDIRNQEPVNPRLGLSMGGASADNSLPSPDVVGIGGNSSERSYRGRTNRSNQPNSITNHLFVPRVSGGHSGSSSGSQPLRLIPFNPPLDLIPQLQPESATSSQSHPVVLRFPGSRRNVQTVRWSGGASSSRYGGSSGTPVVASGRDAPSFNEDINARAMPRNISEHPIFIPSSETRNPSHNPPANLGSNGGHNNASMPRSVVSSSRAGPSTGSHSSSGPSWGSHRHPSSQLPRRLSEHIARSWVHGAVGSTLRSGHPSQEVAPPSGGHNPFPMPGLWMDRNGEGIIGIPYLRGLAAAGEGRSRILPEDLMILDQAVFFGMADLNDQHREMRLDVDNMSYEELLALEERIGNVCTGLSEETISARMKRRKYKSGKRTDQIESKQCCICQEEYNNGEELGMLNCGHDFHTDCIKQWLVQKNLCPICKTTGLAT